MEVIVISGKASGVGKTTLAAEIIKNLKCRTGAIKTSIIEDKPELVSADPEIVEAEGSDTAIMAASGADKVVYLRSDYEHLKENLDRAREMTAELDYLVIEGNSVLDYLNPALIIYLEREELEAKPSAVKAEARADIVIDYRSMTPVINGKMELKALEFELNVERISCFKAHLIGKAFAIKLPLLGKRLDEKGIRINHCQLGLF